MRRRKERPMALAVPDLSYEAGYGRPPLHSRFKKGQSGNPSGRPKASSTWAAVFEAELMFPMIVDGKETSVTVLDALLADAAQRAALGSIPHIMLLMRDEYREPERDLILQFGENDEPV